MYCALLIGAPLWLATSLPSDDLLRALLAVLIFAATSVAAIIAGLLSGRANGLYASLVFCAFITATRPEIIFQIVARAEPVVSVYRASAVLPSIVFARIYYAAQKNNMRWNKN